MAFLKQKSEFNYEAAQILFKQGLHAPCIHCAYYSFFQLLKHILNHVLGISYAKVDKEVNTSTKSEHSYVYSVIRNELRKDREHYREINNQMGELRTFRTQADYKNLQIDSELSDKAIRYANNLNNYFKDLLL